MVGGDEDDGELVRAIARGDEAARAAEALLCRRFAPRIRLYGLRHLGDEDRARDLVQTVLLGVIEAARAGRIEDLAKVDRFVLGTCRNAALRLRAQAMRTRPAEPEELAGLVAPTADTPGAIDAMAILRCFGALDARAQEVLLLSFHDERPADEIAGLFGTTAGNVRVLRHRAILALRQCLEAA
jgi:RNA polymerase sigma-70 factor (ECF subfamily)